MDTIYNKNVKLCTKCHISKNDSDFYLRKTGFRAGELYNHCKTCLRSRGRAYYKANQSRQRSLSNQRRILYRITRRELMVKLKDRPCVDCGKRYPSYVMDFDHKCDDKLGNISSLANRNYVTVKKLLSEIAKCDVVCSNCHRIRTYMRRISKNPC